MYWIIITILSFLILWILIPKRSGNSKLLESHNHILFVTAHPDDECMFFGPSIQSLGKNCDISVLCLSIGNEMGLGSIRRKELGLSCDELGVLNAISLDDPY